MKRKLPRLPFVLLGLMTLFTLAGPLAIGFVLRGGPNPNWPPDRAVEWVTVIGVSTMVALLMIACLSLSLVNRKSIIPSSPEAKPSRDEP